MNFPLPTFTERDILFSLSFKFKGKILPKAQTTDYQILIFPLAFLLLWLNVKLMKPKLSHTLSFK
jgi:hypothetical protein